MRLRMRIGSLLPSAFRCAWMVVAMLAAAPRSALADDAAMIVGIVTNADRQPVAHATVTVTNGSVTRSTESGPDGVYTFTGLQPGTWSVSTAAPGYQAVPPLKVATGGTTRYDIILSATPASGAVAAAPKPAPSAPAVAAAATVPEALQSPEPAPENDTVTPFANAGYTGWMNGTTRENSPIFDTKFFTPEDALRHELSADFNHPKDHTIDGSTEEFRSG